MLINKKVSIPYALAWLLIIIGSLVTIFYCVGLARDQWWIWGEGRYDLEKTGQFGDFVGGFVGTLFSLAGFIFLYLTLREQRGAFLRERFESRYFEMIKLYRDNVAELSATYLERGIVNGETKINSRSLEGKGVFLFVQVQIANALREIEPYFKNKAEADIYVPAYLHQLKNTPTMHSRIGNYVDFARINLGYLVVFFGLGDMGRTIIENVVKDRYNPKFCKEVLDYLQLKPNIKLKYWERWVALQGVADLEQKINLVKKIYELHSSKAGTPIDNEVLPYYLPKGSKKYYTGEQFRLGHYFRHLFQTVKYVNEQPFLSWQEKYGYVKMLRAQMSSHEQGVFFLNSLSVLGHAWELLPEKRNTHADLNYDYTVNHQLITKYNLIKNIPGEHILRDFRFMDYYPDVEYELSDTSENKKNIKKLYT